jgi:hypothetical protein
VPLSKKSLTIGILFVEAGRISRPSDGIEITEISREAAHVTISRGLGDF